VTEFIERVTGKVLRAIAIEILQRKLVLILSPLCDASQLRILFPQIGLYQLRCSQQPEDRNVALCERL
jgi:hypothetical protein